MVMDKIVTNDSSIEDKVELFTAWLKGAKIQMRYIGFGNWYDVAHPSWHYEFNDYRIKSEEDGENSEI